jgi:hypothetical protein
MRERLGRLIIDNYIIKQRDYSLMSRIFDTFIEISVKYDKRRDAFVYYGYSDDFETLDCDDRIPEYMFIENEYGDVRFLKVNKEE